MALLSGVDKPESYLRVSFGLLSRRMKTWVIFLRGVNVGGHNKLPMAELRVSLSEAGFEAIKTYIQSGNIVLCADSEVNCDDVKTRVCQTILGSHGLDVQVLVLSPEQLITAMSHNPFGQEFEKPNFMFLFFMETAPISPDLQTLSQLKTENEKFELIGNVFYAYAGDGAGRSKMFTKIEKVLNVPATARNWRTVTKMSEILRTDYVNT